MIKLLFRLYDPTDGEILVNGINIKEYTIELGALEKNNALRVLKKYIEKDELLSKIIRSYNLKDYYFIPTGKIKINVNTLSGEIISVDVSTNELVFLGRKENDKFIIEDEDYKTNVSDVVDIDVHNFAIKENNSRMVTNVPISSEIRLMQVIYPLRDVELVLDPSDGTKKAIQLAHYIITRTLFNHKMLCKALSDSEVYESNDNYEYYPLDTCEIRQNTLKNNFMIEELNDFNELSINLFLFRDYFLFDFVFPSDNNLSIDFQMWSYSYSLANALLKTMRSVKRNISSIPKPIADFCISLRNNLDDDNTNQE